MFMVVVLHIYVQDYNLSKSLKLNLEKLVWEEAYVTILDQFANNCLYRLLEYQ